MPSNLKVNVCRVSARFSLRHQPCGITRWRGELIKTAHDGFAELFPRKSRSVAESGHAKPPHGTAAHMWFIRSHLLSSKKSVVIKLLHVISLTFSILPTTESHENIWQLLLDEIIREKNPILSRVWDQIHQIRAFTGSGKCISGLQRATYLHLFHTLFLQSVPTTAREHLARSAPHLKCSDQYKCFFFIASVEGFTHITEAKPNCGEYCFWFPQFMKIHHIVWMCPLCSCWERNAEITHRIHVQTHSRSHEKWLHVRAWANWSLVTSLFHKCQWCNTVSPLLHLVPLTTGQVQGSQWDGGQRVSL